MVNKACKFEDEFDAASFCEKMKNSVILFIGDSTSYEQYGSLVNLLGGNTSELLKHRSLLKNLSLVQNVCSNDGGGDISLVFRWSYFLEDIDTFLKETFPTLVVANTGAHFYKIKHPISKRMEEVMGHVAIWQQDCHRKNLPCLFLYRTAPPGHADCKDWMKPENNLSIIEELVATRGTTGRENYHWEDFKLLNDKVLETIDRHANSTRSGTIHVLDGYDWAIRRPDNHLGPHHGDCLHHGTSRAIKKTLSQDSAIRRKIFVFGDNPKLLLRHAIPHGSNAALAIGRCSFFCYMLVRLLKSPFK